MLEDVNYHFKQPLHWITVYHNGLYGYDERYCLVFGSAGIRFVVDVLCGQLWVSAKV